MSKEFLSGFVSLIGRPNVGKSTLMNRLIGEKIAIISNKPQTTRNRIQSILTGDDYQAIFIDTPGIHKPKHKLGQFMVKSAETTLNEVDCILMLIEPAPKVLEMDEHIIGRLEGVKTPVVLVINKMDTVDKGRLLSIMDNFKGLYNFKAIIPISALTGENCETLLEEVKKYFLPGPKYFPDDMVTDQPERQIASEIIREKILMLMQDEIPHGIAVSILSMKKRPNRDLTDVEATIFCEKDSHKGMIIGKQGLMLKKIGQRARQDIENLLGNPINLQLWVKVKKDWRDSEFLLKNFGYDKRNI